ncbi:SANTA domain-containing protein [Vairimorpha necatrix]|uniref:SANTA domain-containing protein n=1 Tax=Vairimorpha necatrix TaxID=6039 RepID=A0AAX4J8A0_9MICR
MNENEDILEWVKFINIPDYTIFKKRTPHLNRYTSKNTKNLNKWYIRIVKNDNPLIGYKYWINVNGYLDNNTFIRSSPIYNIYGPLEVLTAHTKYNLAEDSEVLSISPHIKFEKSKLRKFSKGFPNDWKELVTKQLTKIFGQGIKANMLDCEKKLTSFEKIYNDIFDNQEAENVDAEWEELQVPCLKLKDDDILQEDSLEDNGLIEQDYIEENHDTLETEEQLKNNTKKIKSKISLRRQATLKLSKDEVSEDIEIMSFYLASKKPQNENSKCMRTNMKEPIINIDKSFILTHEENMSLDTENENNNDNILKTKKLNKNEEPGFHTNIKDEHAITTKFEEKPRDRASLKDSENQKIDINEIDESGQSFESVTDTYNSSKCNTNIELNINENIEGDSEYTIDSSYNTMDILSSGVTPDDIKDKDYLQDSKLIESILGLGKMMELISFDHVYSGKVKKRKRKEN